MDAITVLSDAVARPMQALGYFWEELAPSRLNARPGGHPNSIAWLIWHAARETDAQCASLMRRGELWHEDGFDERFGFDRIDLGVADIGFQQSADHARLIAVPETVAGKVLLHDYLAAVYERAAVWICSLSDTDLDRVIDESWDPPVTVGARMLSIIDDAAQHIGQAAYIAGMPRVHE